MLNRTIPVLAFVALTVIASAAALARGTPVPTLEERRFAGELQQCTVLTEGDRMTCAADAQTRIVAAWKARIEAEARRPNHK